MNIEHSYALKRDQGKTVFANTASNIHDVNSLNPVRRVVVLVLTY